jgi:hypothetical protein
MKIVLRTVLVLLLLPVLAFSGVYLYGKVMVWYLLARQEATERSEDIASRAGNGFGGEVGMEVVDSGYWSKNFFWIDSGHLAFQVNRKVSDPKDMQRNYVWHVGENRIKPIALQAGISCFFEDKFFYIKASENEFLPNGRKKAYRFQSRLVEMEDHWRVDGSEKIDSIWPVPSDRYELAWTVGCRPWFRLRSDVRTGEDVPEHRFKYLWEWGWVLRMPLIGSSHYDQAVPQMGFFDIGGKVYSGQDGERVAAPVDMPIKDLLNLKVRYVHFLDRYLLANRLNGSTTKRKVLELIARDGKIKTVKGAPEWPEYSEIPLPTKKGVFWSGYDYRFADSNPYDSGAFIKLSGGEIHKVIKGAALKPQLSSDGCWVAFHNNPKRVRGISSLKVFDVCNSKLTQKELRNYDY